MYVTLHPGTDEEQQLTDVQAVVHDGDGYARLCRDNQPDELLDPDWVWLAVARG